MVAKVEITKKHREQITALAGYGMSNADIASVVGISEATMKRHCQEDLSKGRAVAKLAVQQTAYKMAIGGKQPAMTMFWLKTQCNWKETTVNEHTGKDSKKIPDKIQIEFVKPFDENSSP